MIKKGFITFLLILFGASGVLPGIADHTVYAGTCKGQTNFLGITPWYSGLCKDNTSQVQITNPPTDIAIIILNLISIAIRLAGYAAVGFVIFGGIKYILAAGDSGKIASAKKTITNALIGLLIALSAVAIVNFIASGFN